MKKQPGDQIRLMVEPEARISRAVLLGISTGLLILVSLAAYLYKFEISNGVGAESTYTDINHRIADSGASIVLATAAISEVKNAQEKPSTVEPEPGDISSYEYHEALLERRRSLGFFSVDDLGAYATYSDDALQNLADVGDLMAMQMLAAKLMSTDPEKGIQTYELAAAYGSTSALMFLGTFHFGSANSMDFPNRDRFRISMYGLAFYEVAAMRGDIAGFLIGLKSAERAEFEFTPSRIEMILERALEIYQRLENTRAEVGLPPFDNNVPPILAENHEFWIDGIPNPTGWGLQYY